ncbi:bifunctional phosphatase PAP2/diacylglycerol kinase family protein [Actinomadura xylanilytica]|uniref:bifunctional phosphatase PAP2/diacylglycerol kinase family protein n=1 Tax=Actinomadura xylanilytica TaxID=887459 RepID=UPI00255A7977|nr:bifunctional phosphatase PAP2/diacylglycerol kinase family protein [Actinomadura xylanilytica]MDL4772646.1 phosphatase PAP2 family protein [Actinomadura xylanilytica]
MLLRRLGRLDRWAFDRVASARLPGLEYVLPRLSRLADHGLLWFSGAAVLGASNRARLRRASLRGSLAIAVASPLVNIAGKHAFRRKRPVLDLVPPIRIRWKPPTSHAFPSGHSASAAAFATGVALEAPAAVAAPVAVTAVAVAFSRIYTGAHYPGDVLAGLGIGALAGFGTRLLWPARPPVAHVTRTTTEPVQITEDGQGVVVVANPGSGPGPGAGVDERSAGATAFVPSMGEPPLELLARELPAAEIVRLEPGDDIEKVFDEAAGRAAVLAVVGGDGSVNAAARAALRHEVPLLVVPGGTFDHFARALGIETAADAVAAYRGALLGRVDVAFVLPTRGGTGAGPDADEALPFLNTASFGAYTELVERRERLEDRLGKWPALAVAAVRTLRHSEPVEVVVDGRRRRVWLGFVGNCAYGSRGPAPTWREHLDDGRLDIRMVTTGHRVPRVRAVAAILAGHLHLTPGYRAWTGGSLELVSLDGGLPVARDGEVSTLSSVLRFGKHPGGLPVFCPPVPR